MPELPKFDDEDLKSYGDEEEELALCVFFPSLFIGLSSIFLNYVKRLKFAAEKLSVRRY